LGSAVDMAQDLVTELRKNRIDFPYFKNFMKLSVFLNIEETKKRTVKVQTASTNPNTNSIDDYFRITIFNLFNFTNHVIQHLQERFTAHESLFKGFASYFAIDDLKT